MIMKSTYLSAIYDVALLIILTALFHGATATQLSQRSSPTPPPPPPVKLLPVAGAQHCVFPFWWHGRWHHTCVRYNLKGEQWCSITANFTKDENWMRCDSHDVKRFHCRIPFQYGGRLHFSCLPLSMAGPRPGSPPISAFWCGLKASVGAVSWQNQDWAFCESPNATTSDYLKAVGWHRGLNSARLAALLKIARHRNIVKSEVAGSNPAKAELAAVASGGSGGDGSGGGGGGDSSGGDDDGSSRWGVGLVVSLGVACGLLTLAVATTGCAVHRRYFRGRYKRVDPLLTSDTMEKSGYGGIEAYHD